MADTTDGGFPRRDARRRIVTLRDLLAVTLAGVVAAGVALAVLDGLFALIGLGGFGRVNGWLAVILPVMLLVEEFRAWRGVRARIGVAFGATLAGVAAGLLVAGLVGDLPGLLAGALGAAAFTAVYAPVWYYGIRAVGGRTGEEGP